MTRSASSNAACIAINEDLVLHLDALGACVLEHVGWIAWLSSAGRPSQKLVDEHDYLDSQLSCGGHYDSLWGLHAQM